MDAYIGARCPATAPIIDASELVEVGVTAKRPKLTGIFRPAADFAPLPISIPEPPVLRPCPQCTKGVLPAGRTCPTCRGTRHDKCNMGYDHDCEECDGKGTLGEAEACYKCWGTGFDGVRLMASAVKVGPALLGWRFATLLRKHGAVAFAHSNGSAREPLRWIIPGTNVDGTVYVMHEV